MTTLGIIARPLTAIQLCVGIRGRRVRRVAAPLAPKGHARIARIIGGRLGRGVASLETFLTGPGFQQRPIDGEMFVRQQAGDAGLTADRIEERRGDVASQQALTVLAERGRRPDRIVHVQADEPAEEQVVLQFFHQQPLAAHGVQHLQQQRAQQLFRRHRGTSDRRVERVELRRQLAERGVRHRANRAQRMVGGNPLFRREITEQVFGLLIVSAQRDAPGRDVVARIVVRDRPVVDPWIRPFSSAC